MDSNCEHNKRLEFVDLHGAFGVLIDGEGSGVNTFSVFDAVTLADGTMVALPAIPGKRLPPHYRKKDGSWEPLGGQSETLTVRDLREKLRERTAMIEELVWAMHLDAQSTGEGVGPDSYPAFQSAIKLAGIPVEWKKNEDGDLSYRFTDLGWCERQRAVWQRRNAE